jgi:hypothetical protein
MSEPQRRRRRRPVYLLRLESLRGDDTVRGSRLVLKSLLRRHGLCCLSIEEAAQP